MSENSKRERSKKGFAGQHEDEEVLVVERLFPIVMRRPLIFGMIIVVFALLPWAIATYYVFSWIDYTYWWMLAGALILLFYWVRTWVGWYYSVYVLTSQRVMVVKQKGFFSRDVSELTLNNVQNVNYSQKGVQAALFGFGTVTVETLSGGTPLKLTMVSKPVQLQKAIVEAAHRYSGSNKHN